MAYGTWPPIFMVNLVLKEEAIASSWSARCVNAEMQRQEQLHLPTAPNEPQNLGPGHLVFTLHNMVFGPKSLKL